jgi:hypothetical protein
LKPITLAPLKFTAEYREETFFTWEPNVFQTTPPHPASKAQHYFLKMDSFMLHHQKKKSPTDK